MIPLRTNRTGSYPFMDLANHFGLPLEVVYTYAHQVRERMLGRTDGSVWAKRALSYLKEHMLLSEQKVLSQKVDWLTETWLKKQGFIK